MDPIPVIVKHGGKKYDLELDPTSNGETFKYQVFSVTGVEPERQKIIVKGGQLKDDADLSKLGVKSGHQFMMMGTPSGGAKAFERPKEQPKFMEDMTEAEQAKSEGATPAGLQNLGNTCYLNSTLQTLKAIPELQNELQVYKDSTSAGAFGGSNSLGDLSRFGLGGLGSSTDVTASLRDLYKQMSETQEGIPPLMFLNAFRTAFPQFAERTRDGQHYAQQDAEEAWSQIITSLKGKLKSTGEANAEGATSAEQSFIDKYMGGKFQKIEECTDPAAIEAGEKPQKKDDELFYKLNCHVSAREILHLRDGVAAALSDTYTKTSPTLNRETEYVTKSRMARLPKYLPVHFVRFFWKRDVNKKAKILRKVTFPQELDVIEYCSDELKSQLIPVRDKIRELRKEELDVERARKRQRRMDKAEENDIEPKASADSKKSTAADSKPKDSSDTAAAAAADTETYKTDAERDAEAALRVANLKRDVLSSVSAELAADATANQTGLYELRALVTHKGASADSGHYTAYVKKEPRKKTDPATGKSVVDDADIGPGNSKWWWFDDDKVSEVDEDKIALLSGGGETHSALILLYRAVELPVVEEQEGAAAGAS